jgi:retinitis pigmentosa 9 protein
MNNSTLESREDEKEREIVRKNLGKFQEEGESDSASSEESENPEDCIPDLPENAAAREFLRIAPRKGLHMPLGKEVKVMQCFRCKAYGHRTGDRECPLTKVGNVILDTERKGREDPMSDFVAKQSKKRELEEIKLLVEQIRQEEKEKDRKNKKRKKHKKEKSEKKSKKKRKND